MLVARVIGVVVVACLGLCGWAHAQTDTAQSESVGLAHGLVELSADEVHAAGIDLATAIKEGGPQVLIQRMHTGAFMDRLTADLGLGEDDLRDLRINWSYDDILEELLFELELGGLFEFMSVIERKGEHRARFRLVGFDLGLNYFDILLARDPWDTYRILDLTPMAMGADLSSFIRLFVPASPPEDGDSGELSIILTPMTLFGMALMSDNAEGAWRQCPDVIESQPEAALVLYGLCARLGTYLFPYESDWIVDDFAESFSDHPTTYLNLFDLYLVRGEHRKALEALEQLENLVEDDGLYDALRGAVHLDLGNHDQARRLLKRATTNLSHIEALAVFELEVSLAADDFHRSIELIQHLENRFGYTVYPDEMEADPDLAGLVASEPYQAWLSSRDE